MTVFVLGLTGHARAEDVDWSQYVEAQPARVAKPTSTAQKATKPQRAKKAVAKKSSSRSRLPKRAAKSAKKPRRR